MMLSHFQAYIPELWYEEGLAKTGLASSDEHGDLLEAEEGKAGNRTDYVKVTVRDGIAINSVVLSTPPSDSALSRFQTGGEYFPNVKYARHSASATNKSFSELFAKFRDGVRLINDGQIRAKAKAASVLRRKEPERSSWAKRLADDVKDADD
jgi:hypothetical protein